MIMKAAVLFLICLNSEAIFFSITLKQTNKKNSYSVAQNSVWESPLLQLPWSEQKKNVWQKTTLSDFLDEFGTIFEILLNDWK